MKNRTSGRRSRRIGRSELRRRGITVPYHVSETSEDRYPLWISGMGILIVTAVLWTIIWYVCTSVLPSIAHALFEWVSELQKPHY